MMRSLLTFRALTLLAAITLLAAAPAPARADLAAGLSAPAPPAQGGANVSDLLTDGLEATGEIKNEDALPAGTTFDNVTAGLETAASDFDDSIGDGTSGVARAAAGAVAAAAAACAAAVAL